MAGTTGLEPATSAVTGQRSNQLSYVPKAGPAAKRRNPLGLTCSALFLAPLHLRYSTINAEHLPKQQS